LVKYKQRLLINKPKTYFSKFNQGGFRHKKYLSATKIKQKQHNNIRQRIKYYMITCGFNLVK